MTDKNVLILGYGRAGKRHVALAEKLGLTVYVYDPYLPAGTIESKGQTAIGRTIKSTQDFIYDLRCIVDANFTNRVIICTPPKDHLWQIKVCLDAGVSSILCEKPLCAIGGLDEAKALPEDAPVMVAYNYRYHHKLAEIAGTLDTLQIQCEQQRTDLPDWGLLLDHCSHDLDIARMISGGDLDVSHARKMSVKFGSGVDVSEGADAWIWNISTDRGPVSEMVTTRTTQRQAIVRYPYPTTVANQKRIDIDPDPAMFTAMWQAFLDGDYWPNLAEAIKTQELLEKCYNLNKDMKNGDS